MDAYIGGTQARGAFGIENQDNKRWVRPMFVFDVDDGFPNRRSRLAAGPGRTARDLTRNASAYGIQTGVQVDLTRVIRNENDKARFSRDVPITDRARKAIDSRFPCDGTIFPEFDCRDLLRGAARAAGISAHRASKLSIYDFRHGRATEWGRTGNLIGIAYLMGPPKASTTRQS